MLAIKVQNIDDKTEIQQLRRLEQDLTDQTDDYKDQVYVPALNTFSFTQSIDQAFNNNSSANENSRNVVEDSGSSPYNH